MRIGKYMKKNTIKTCVFGALALCVMTAIFAFSHQTGASSSQVSNRVGKVVLVMLGITVPEGQSASSVVIFWGLTVRSLAHIFLFAVLGITLFLTFNSAFVIKCEKSRRTVFYAAACALIVSLLYAVSDEVHQYFVSGRTASFRDVMIDASGFVCSIIIASAVTLLTLPKGKITEKQNDGQDR